MTTETRRLLRAVVATALVLLVANVGTRAYILTSLNPRANDYRAASADLANFHTAMVDEETGLRGYLATGDQRFLQPYQEAKPILQHSIRLLAGRLHGAQAQALLATEQTAQRWNDAWAEQALGPSFRARLGLSGLQTPAQRAGLTGFLLRGKALFDAYRDAEGSLQLGIDNAVATTAHTESLWLLWSGLFQGAIAAAVVGIAIAARHRLARRVTAPIETIAGTVRRMTAGDLTQPDDLPGAPAELALLNTDVGRMAGALTEQMQVAKDRRVRADDHARRLSVVLEAAREVAGSLNPRYVMASVISAAQRLGFDSARIWLLDDERTQLQLAFDSEARAGAATGDLRCVGVDVGIIGRAVRYGTPAGPEPLADGRGAEVAVPLIVGARVTGALECVAHDAALAHDVDVMSVLEALSVHAAGAVAAARLHDETLRHAVTDALTELPNRRAFDRELPVEIARSQRYSRPLSLISVDLDHFKQVNDRFGHAYGDRALQQVARTLHETARDADTVYRLGGEEIAVLCPETRLGEAMDFAERLRTAVEQSSGDHGPKVTASFGVAELARGDADGMALLAAADQALYAAKADGRNCVRAAAEPLPSPRLVPAAEL